jgi:hypothetical protein
VRRALDDLGITALAEYAMSLVPPVAGRARPPLGVAGTSGSAAGSPGIV